MSRADIVDLRSSIDQVYAQGPINACKAYSIKAAMEAMADRDPAHAGMRLSAMFLHNLSRQLAGNLNMDTGATDWNAQDALHRYGICLEQDFQTQSISEVPGLVPMLKAQRLGPVDYQPIPYVDIPDWQNSAWPSVCRSIDFGFPVVITVNMTPGLVNSRGVWHEMNHDASAPTLYEHSMTVVGYHRTKNIALVENSWGPAWGDGGFCGLPLDKFNQGPQQCVKQIWRLEKFIAKPKKVDGFMPGAPVLTNAEARSFAYVNKNARVAALSEALERGGWIAVRDECVRLGVSDKLVEEDFGLQRGDFQAWFNTHNIPQGAMIWLPLI